MPANFSKVLKESAKAEQLPLIRLVIDDRHVLEANGGGLGEIDMTFKVSAEKARELLELGVDLMTKLKPVRDET